MCFIFADSPSKFKDYTEKGWLYFFLTQLQPNDCQAFVKFGLTKHTLIERLDNYKSLNIANIYAIQTPCEEVSIRECVMKQIFKVCKEAKNVDIWEDHGVEYLKGTLDIMLRVFLYFCTSSLEEAKMYKTRNKTIEKEHIVEWIDKLPHIESYNINKLSYWKPFKIIKEIDSLLEVTIDDKIQPKTNSILNNEIEHDNSSSLYKCTKCGKEYKDKRGLSLHLRRCDYTNNTICEYCNVTFKSVYVLERHLLTCVEYRLHKQKKEFEQIIASYESDNTDLKIKIQNLLQQKEESKTMIENIKEEEEKKYNQLKQKYEKEIERLIEDKRELILNNQNLSNNNSSLINNILSLTNNIYNLR